MIILTKTILVIEDELDIQNILKTFLEDAGYSVDVACDGINGISKFHASKPDLILLDIMLPRINGYSVLEILRKESDIPVIMLTALDEEDDQARGFELMADDYIIKPFSMKLVLKRVEAVLRRASGGFKNCNVMSYRNIQIDKDGYKVFVSGTAVNLTTREFELLRCFLENQGRVFTRENLLNQIWGYDYLGDGKIVNTHIKNIRKKLGVDCIDTIRGVGYRVDKEN
jgi:two-component system response regulator VanR